MSQKQLFKKKFSQKEEKRKKHKKGEIIQFDDYPEFQPNLTPYEILQIEVLAHILRPIYSSITKKHYNNAIDEYPS